MNIGTVIILCLASFIIGEMVGDHRTSKVDEFYFGAMLDDHQEDIKILINKIAELQQKGGVKK